MTEFEVTRGVANNGTSEIAYETFVNPDGRPLLLVMGIGGQLLDWPDDFCWQLVGRGFSVTRFDNRDAGLSTHLSERGRPHQLTMLIRPAAAAAYRLTDMAGDAVAVLDAIGWPAAHVVGISLGGAIAQTMAVHRSDRVLTLTSISSTPAPRLGQPAPRTLLKIMRTANPKRVKSREDFAEYAVGLHRVVGSPGYPADEEALREHARRSYDRSPIDLAAVQRQTAAIAASGDRRVELAEVRCPTLVLHGESDQLIRPIGGSATAAAIPHARLVTYSGMGHDLPPALWASILDDIATLAE